MGVTETAPARPGTPAAPRTAGRGTGTSSPRAVLRRSRRWYASWIVVWLALLGLGLALPDWLDDAYYQRIAVQGAVLGLLALSIGWLLRQTGLLSFGHAGFYAVGAYLSGIGVTHWNLSTAESVLLGIAAAALLGFVAGIVIVRTSGITFAMLTLAVGQIVYVAATNTRSLSGGFDGLLVTYPGSLFGDSAANFTRPDHGWLLSWCCVLGVGAVLWWASRTVYGRRLTAIRENEQRVRFLGRQTLMPRVGALTISAAVAGLAGVLHALTAGLITPDDASWTTSGLALIVAVIGGVGSLIGPVAAGIGFLLLRSELSGTSHFQLITGLILIAVVIAAPGGFAAVLTRGARAGLARLRPARGRGDDAA